MSESIVTVFGIINTIWKHAKLDPDDEGTRRVWDMALKDLPLNTVLMGAEALARVEDKFVPNPGRFRRICLDAAEIERQAEARNADQRLFAEAKIALRDRSPREAALAATRTAYLRRIIASCGKSRVASAAIGMVGEASREDAFNTDFDWEYVAHTAALPASDDRADHDIAWAELSRVFDVEWESRQ